MLETMDGSFFLDSAEETSTFRTPQKESRTISRPQPKATKTSPPASTSSVFQSSPPQQQPVTPAASLRFGIWGRFRNSHPIEIITQKPGMFLKKAQNRDIRAEYVDKGVKYDFGKMGDQSRSPLTQPRKFSL